VKDADQLIADALRDIAAEAGPPRPVADAAWRAGRRRRLTALAAGGAAIAGAIALALALVLPPAAAPRPGASPTAAPGPASPQSPPGRLVSITLTPATPASTQVLARAAHLLGQRAASLHLPSTQAQVSGPDVVLTGPAADQAQLTAIAAAGVLNFRQVLLYQAYNGGPAAPASPVYGDASLVNRDTLELFRKLACEPGDSSTWTNQVGYAAAADYDNPGTQVVSCDSSGNKYALDVAKVPGTQIADAAATQSEPSNQWTVAVRLSSAGAAAFGTLTTELNAKYYAAAGGNPATSDYWLDTVAIVLDGTVINAPEIEQPIPFGMIVIPGNFSRAQAEDLAADLRSGPLPAGFRVSAVSALTPSATSQAAA
jgi:preprotein translocase subunit SecD